MKKSIRKIGLILMTILVAAFLAACSAGSTVETTLTINDDLSGTRVMELVIDDEVFDENFTGTIEELSETITETCPAELAWVYDDSTGERIYTFTLEFSSVADYKTKVDTIIGEGSDVEITIAEVDSVWASGIKIKESFSSSELLQWLEDAVVEKGFVDASDASNVFSLGGNMVEFKGSTYSTSDYIDCDEMEYVSINSINMFTDMKAIDCYSKKIELSIPASSMKLKGNEIKSWLQERVPEGAEANWVEDGSDSVFTVSKADMTTEELTVFLNEYFDTDACTVEQNKVTDNMSPFSFNIELVESIDFSNYALGDKLYQTTVNYVVKGENGYVGGMYLSDLAYYDEDDTIGGEFEGYRYGDSDYYGDTTREYTAYFQKVYRVSDISIESKIGLFGGLSREIQFTLDGEPTKEEKQEMMDNIEALGVAYYEEKAYEEEQERLAKEALKGLTEDALDTLDDSEDAETEEAEETEEEKEIKPEWNLKIKDKTQKGNYIITLIQKGSREEIKECSEALFDDEGDFYRVKDFGFGKLNYAVSVYDDLSLGDFVDYTTEDVTSKYTLKTGFLSKVTYTDEGDDAKIDGGKVTMKEEYARDYVNIVTYGTQFNLWALLFYIAILVFVVSVIIVLKNMGVFAKLFEKMKAKKAAAPMVAAQQPVYQQAPVEQPVYQEVPVQQTESVTEAQNTVEGPKFCPKCGTKREADAVFCGTCGEKF